MDASTVRVKWRLANYELERAWEHIESARQALADVDGANAEYGALLALRDSVVAQRARLLEFSR
jgi:hypothetical protein